MRRIWVSLIALVGMLACAAPGSAQVFIRVPFVRVAVGPPAWPGGPSPVYVRAPFVRINTGGPAPVIIGAPPPGIVGAPVIVPPAAPAAPEILDTPRPLPQDPAQAPRVPPPQGRDLPVPAPPAGAAAQQQPAPPAATTEQQPAPPTPQVVPNRAMTVEEFAKAFHPAAGKYQVTLLHPRTNNPVNVAFTLPEGTPRVRVTGRELDFDYGQQEVEIRFLIGGRVEVAYRD